MNTLPIINGVLLLAAAAVWLMFAALPALIPPLADWHGSGAHSVIENASYLMIGAMLVLIAFYWRSRPVSSLFSIAAMLHSFSV